MYRKIMIGYFIAVVPVLTILLCVAVGLGVAKWNNVPPEPTKPATEATAYIYTDISAQTGFLNSKDVMARFECLEYPIADSEEYEKVFLIDVYRYPEIDFPVSFRVDTFEEAVEFLEGIN